MLKLERSSPFFYWKSHWLAQLVEHLASEQEVPASNFDFNIDKLYCALSVPLDRSSSAWWTRGSPCTWRTIYMMGFIRQILDKWMGLKNKIPFSIFIHNEMITS